MEPMEPLDLRILRRALGGTRVTTSKDTLPLPWSDEGQIENDAGKLCRVCRRNEARYCCPRCSLRFCSATCYQNHIDSNASGRDLCTERFFKGRVSQVLELEAKERRDETTKMLSRALTTSSTRPRDVAPLVWEQFDEEELLNILQTVERGSDDEIEKIISSPRVRLSLQRLLEKEQFATICNIHPWQPWWIPVYSQEQETNTPLDNADEATLDERIFGIQSSSRMNRSGCTGPDLRCNVVDILYSTVWTLRLFHGIKNAKDGAIDAADALIRASSVLRCDERWNDLHSVLMQLTADSTRSQQYGTGCNTDCAILLQDVALICENARLIARALFEVVDLMKAANAAAKQRQLQATRAYADRKRVRLKVEFYIDWCWKQSEALSTLTSEIRTWQRDWIPCDGKCDDSIFHAIPKATAKPTEHDSQEILLRQKDTALKEISSTRKVVKHVT